MERGGEREYKLLNHGVKKYETNRSRTLIWNKIDQKVYEKKE